MNSIFFSQGGGGYFWEVAVGVCRLALLIFTLFQSNIYEVNVREYGTPRGFMSSNEHYHNSMMA